MRGHNGYLGSEDWKRVRILVALLMLGLSLSGCLKGDETDPVVSDPVWEVSRKLFDILPVEEVWVSASDGRGMHNAVYRPDTLEPVPVFINFSPYWGDTAEAGGDNFARLLVEEYVPRGYAVVLSAVRGTGHSEGCFQIAGDREVEDLWDVIDFFASEPWSNGRVAAGGKSYDSTTQNGLVAKMPHPALKGIFHVSGITDMYRYNYVGGVPYANGLAFTPRYYATQGTDEGVAGSEGSIAQEKVLRAIDDAACPEAAKHVASGTGSALHGLKDDYWQERDWNRFVGASDWDGSVFFVHGLQDWNVKPDHILPWLDALPEQVRVRAWLHQDTENLGHVYPMRNDWNQTMLAWLDSELKGYDNGFWDQPAFDVEGTDGLWRRTDDWPPAAAPAMLEPDEATWNLVANDGGYEAHAVWDLAKDQAVRLSGAPTLHITASVAHPDAVLTAVLYDRAPDGSETWVGEAVLRAVYRDGLDAPSPVVPVQSAPYALTAYPLDVVLTEGHSLVARLGAPSTQAITTPEDLAGVLYDMGPGAPVLEAHLLPADARADQPEPTPCFAC